MKFRVMMKTPDVLDDSIRRAIDEASGGFDENRIDPREVKKVCEKWFSYSEYLTVEVDTVAKTCTVVEA